MEVETPVAERKWEPLPEKVKIMVTVLTYAKQVGADVFSWCVNLASRAKEHPRVGEIVFSYTAGYPTDRCRNAAAAEATNGGYHLLLQADDDMHPDVMAKDDPDAKPFFATTLDFMLAHDGPCMVGAPYMSAPPRQQVLVMRNRLTAPDHLNGCGHRIDKYTIEEAVEMRGIQRCAALPTGLLMTDTRAFRVIHPPWFSYEFEDPPWNTKLASTEDVVFTRNATWMHLPCYANWDAWAGHCKSWLTTKPRLCPVDEVPHSVWKAFKAGWRPRGEGA